MTLFADTQVSSNVYGPLLFGDFIKSTTDKSVVKEETWKTLSNLGVGCAELKLNESPDDAYKGIKWDMELIQGKYKKSDVGEYLSSVQTGNLYIWTIDGIDPDFIDVCKKNNTLNSQFVKDNKLEYEFKTGYFLIKSDKSTISLYLKMTSWNSDGTSGDAMGWRSWPYEIKISINDSVDQNDIIAKLKKDYGEPKEITESVYTVTFSPEYLRKEINYCEIKLPRKTMHWEKSDLSIVFHIYDKSKIKINKLIKKITTEMIADTYITNDVNKITKKLEVYDKSLAELIESYKNVKEFDFSNKETISTLASLGIPIEKYQIIKTYEKGRIKYKDNIQKVIDNLTKVKEKKEKDGKSKALDF